MYNATCRIYRANQTLTGTGGVTRGHREDGAEEVRCSLRQLSVERAQTIFGSYQAEAWACRLHKGVADVPVQTRVLVKRDGQADYAEYAVQTARREAMLTLYLTRVA